MAAFDAIKPAVCDVIIISGVEIPCDWLGREIHVVGIFVDQHNTELKALLSNQQKARGLRVAGMSEKLNAMGSPSLTEYLESLSAIAPLT